MAAGRRARRSGAVSSASTLLACGWWQVWQSPSANGGCCGEILACCDEVAVTGLAERRALGAQQLCLAGMRLVAAGALPLRHRRVDDAQAGVGAGVGVAGGAELILVGNQQRRPAGAVRIVALHAVVLDRLVDHRALALGADRRDTARRAPAARRRSRCGCGAAGGRRGSSCNRWRRRARWAAPAWHRCRRDRWCRARSAGRPATAHRPRYVGHDSRGTRRRRPVGGRSPARPPAAASWQSRQTCAGGRRLQRLPEWQVVQSSSGCTEAEATSAAGGACAVGGSGRSPAPATERPPCCAAKPFSPP